VNGRSVRPTNGLETGKCVCVCVRVCVYPVVLVGSNCSELCLNEHERLDVTERDIAARTGD